MEIKVTIFNFYKMVCSFKTVAIDTPGGKLSLMIKSRAQQINLKPNIWIALKMLYILVNSETLAHNFFAFIMFGFKVICWALLFILKLIVCSILVIQTILSSYFIAS